MLGKSVKSVIETGADLAESGNYEESQEFMGLLKDLLKMEQRVGKEIVKAEQFGRAVAGDGIEVAGRVFEEMKALTEGRADTMIKWSDNSAMKEYNEITWESGPGFGNRQGYPLIVNDDGREDEFVMQMRDSMICPISQGQMREPVKNHACGHAYSKEMIERMFYNGQQTISCPVSGCSSAVQKRNLVKDENLERKLAKLESRIFI